MKNSTLIISSSIALITAFAVGAYIYTNQQKQEQQQIAQSSGQELTRFGMPSIGAADAKVNIVEFFDPACEACRAFYPVVKNTVNFNGDKVKLTLRYATFHQGSDYVAKALEATRLQNKYWESVEAVLASQPEWAAHGAPQPELIWNALAQIGLDVEKAKLDMNSPQIAARLAQDAADVVTLKVQKTPSFFVNSKPLTTFGADAFNALVQSEVAIAYPK
ncbi:thioredoxin domain-containing protein [Deefgea tanakiae]|uniref:Thioredoxin domain-containing protein n=1 Tax=Deefgea tanakiae TaxID=2865840 RepID=A0ABX8ZAG3_9NEIS|nr:thioredoxin domain-containing protein [Deefgea tanakiae]QZA78150.1 thioredoxin domain-containing protein [Deefgea tanakiae]